MKLLETNQLVKLSKWLFWLNTAVWLTFGIWSLIRIGNSAPDSRITLWVIAILMLGNATAFLFCGWAIEKQNHLLHIAIITVLVVNIVLTFTDQFGIFDLLTLLLDLILLALAFIRFRKL